jgi:hypothetical protein
LRTATEANARYVEAMTELVNQLEQKQGGHDDFSKMINQLTTKHDLKITKNDKQYRRFISRAKQIYDEYN